MLVSSIQKTHSHATYLRVPFLILCVASVNDNLENVVSECDYITKQLHIPDAGNICNLIVYFLVFISDSPFP